MSTVELFRTQARYNQWMNEHFYGLCDSISDEERKRDAGAFFKSIHGTLNHLLLGDRLWMSRFLNTVFEVDSLDQELYSDYEELKNERVLTDKSINEYISGLSDEDIKQPLTFRSKVKNADTTLILKDALLHFFHHQTHHRGQVSTLISQQGIDIGVTDMIWMPGMEK